MFANRSFITCLEILASNAEALGMRLMQIAAATLATIATLRGAISARIAMASRAR
jgi:hypothetical protein